MDYRITPDDRTRFKRCRRQWDFASSHRRSLEPSLAHESSFLAAALVEALAVYYYPGTWDWQHDLKQSLVHKSIRRTLEAADRMDECDRAMSLVDAYDGCAMSLDDFAPVKIGHDVTALLRDPIDQDSGLLASDGAAISYTCRIDLLAVDAADEYWVMRHLIADDWLSMDELVLDEQSTAACWAWEQDYLGMEIAGTIHNEIRLDGTAGELAAMPGVKPVSQHEASGGGRSIPQHVRASARGSRPAGDRIEQRTSGMLRRTRIRRSRDELAAAGRLVSVEAIEMTGSPTIYPSPGVHCGNCEFEAPCLSMFVGADPEPLFARDFRHRADEADDRPRLGRATWGFGRGAAPPNW